MKTKNTFTLIGIIALVAAAFLFTACSGTFVDPGHGGFGGDYYDDDYKDSGSGSDSDSDSDSDSGGDIPSELVGTWGKQINSNNYQAMFVIDADGDGTWGDPNSVGIACSWSVSGNELTLYYGGQDGTIDWEVKNGQLLLTGPASGTLAAAWAAPTQSSPLDKKSN